MDGKIRVTKGNDSRRPKSVVCAETDLWEPNESLLEKKIEGLVSV
jgi:hypothetical protein